ncbi:MAG: sugar porter family MFS transporter [Novosphingobium sp.]|nr:sugar porter family MFS transporter [Novosphingobium sp.]MCP5400851.1 sugar porter family MFS transporter [Novosphingobium sp.]
MDRTRFGYITTIVAIATIGGFMFGYDSGVINGTQKGLETAFGLGSLGLGINVGAILIGCAVGAFIAGRLADAIGRRGVMLAAAVLFLVSAVLTGIAGSSAEFIAGRIVGGLGVGAASVIAPVYISEVVPADRRGRLSSIQQVMIIVGLTGSFLTNFALARFAGGSTFELWLGIPAWRWMFLIEGVPAVIYFFALLLIPESPRYLVIKRHKEKALEVLTRLFGREAALARVKEIERSLAADHHRPRFSDLIDKTSGRVRKIVWVGIGLAMFQQLVGINVVFYYGATLWEAVGFSEDQALQTNVLSGVLSISACLVAIGLVDRIGRRPLLKLGSIGMALALATVAWAFFSGTRMPGGELVLPGNSALIALVAANLYVVFFNASWGPIMWVMLGEMFPNQIRGSGLAVAGFAQWIANAVVSVSFPSLVEWPGLALSYVGYSLFAVLSYVFVRMAVHETNGIELEDMAG